MGAWPVRCSPERSCSILRAISRASPTRSSCLRRPGAACTTSSAPRALAWAIGIADPAEIDRYNIHRASLLAMARAVGALAPNRTLCSWMPFISPDFPWPSAPSLGGDRRCSAIAAASIVAKVDEGPHDGGAARERLAVSVRPAQRVRHGRAPDGGGDVRLLRRAPAIIQTVDTVRHSGLRNTVAPFDREGALKRAEKALRQGRVDAAIAEYQGIVLAQPRDWNSANALGRPLRPSRTTRQGRRAIHAHRGPPGRGRLLSESLCALQEDPQGQALRRVRPRSVRRRRHQTRAFSPTPSPRISPWRNAGERPAT